MRLSWCGPLYWTTSRRFSTRVRFLNFKAVWRFQALRSSCLFQPEKAAHQLMWWDWLTWWCESCKLELKSDTRTRTDQTFSIDTFVAACSQRSWTPPLDLNSPIYFLILMKLWSKHRQQECLEISSQEARWRVTRLRAILTDSIAFYNESSLFIDWLIYLFITIHGIKKTKKEKVKRHWRNAKEP